MKRCFAAIAIASTLAVSAPPNSSDPALERSSDSGTGDVVVPAAGGTLSTSGVLHLLRLHGPSLSLRRIGEERGRPALDLLLDATVGAEWLGEPAFCRDGSRMIFPTSPGNGAPRAGDQTHQDQCLASFAEMGLPLSTPLVGIDPPATLAEALEGALPDIHLRQAELEWSVIALAGLRPSSEAWRNRFGQELTLDALSRELLDRDIDFRACGGTHRLAAFAAAWRAHRRSCCLDHDTFTRIDALLRRAIHLLADTQELDGSWSIGWGAEQLGNGRDAAGIVDTPVARMLATGHLCEWLLTLESELAELVHPSTLASASAWLIDALAKLPAREAWEESCPTIHAMRAVALASSWRDETIASRDLWRSGTAAERVERLDWAQARRSNCGIHALRLFLGWSNATATVAEIEARLGLRDGGHSMGEMADAAAALGVPVEVVRCRSVEELRKLPVPAVLLTRMSLERAERDIGHFLDVLRIDDGRAEYIEPTSGMRASATLDHLAGKIAGFAMIPRRRAAADGRFATGAALLALVGIVIASAHSRRARFAAALAAVAFTISDRASAASPQAPPSRLGWRSGERDGEHALQLLLRARGGREGADEIGRALEAASHPRSLADLARAMERLGRSAKLLRAAPGPALGEALPAIALLRDPRAATGRFVVVVGASASSVSWIEAGQVAFQEAGWSEFAREWTGHLLVIDLEESSGAARATGVAAAVALVAALVAGLAGAAISRSTS